MGLILEIKAGPFAGKKISLVTGQTVTFGRAAGRADFGLPHDTFMSGVHFAVECSVSGCRVQDRKSSNGTFLNGARIQDAMLANGDEITGGKTIFAVKIVADAKLSSLLPQDLAPPAVSERLLREAEAVPPGVPERPLPRAPEPASPSGLEEPPRAAHGPGVEPPSPAMRTADLSEKAAEPSPVPNGAIEAAQASDSAGEPGAPKFLGTLEPQQLPAGDAERKSKAPADQARPRVEESAQLRATSDSNAAGGPLQRGVENPPGVGANPPAAVRPPRAGENPPGTGGKPPQARPRGSEPPAGVSPYMADKFAERLGARDAGGARSRAFSVMGWSFPAAPAEWQVQEGFGLQQSGHDEFPSSVAATEELLGGITLPQFVESQISMLRGYLRDAKIEPTMPPRVGGADESMAMDVRHLTKDGRELVYRRIYARSGSSVGVLTVTTLAADLPQVLQSLQPLLDGAAFRATVNH